MSFEQLVTAVNSGRNVFLTGAGGTGKSYLLKKLLALEPLSWGITSSTAISAIPLGGMTFHRYTGIGGHQSLDDYFKYNQRVHGNNKLAYTKRMVIEEISMISAEQFDLFDAIARASKMRDEPFGGIQLLVLGDFYQLPPVKGQFAFKSKAWKEANFEVINLVEIKRQNDLDFINALNDVRIGNYSKRVDALFKNRKGNHESLPLSIFSKNSKVDELNSFAQKRRGKDIKTLNGVLSGRCKKSMHELLSGLKTPKELHLSIGDRVMITQNQPSYGDLDKNLEYVNGEMGIYLGIESRESSKFRYKEDTVVTHPLTGEEYYMYRGDNILYFEAVVRLDDGSHVWVPRYTWNYGECHTVFDTKKQKYVDQYDASFTQFPLTLAYAITTHKSQGQSISNMAFDADGVFCPHMSYVGLSRATTLDHLSVINFSKSSVWVDPEVRDFYERL